VGSRYQVAAIPPPGGGHSAARWRPFRRQVAAIICRQVAAIICRQVAAIICRQVAAIICRQVAAIICRQVAAIICRRAHWGKPLATPGQPLSTKTWLNGYLNRCSTPVLTGERAGRGAWAGGFPTFVRPAKAVYTHA
jgi:hypothetical protein